MSPSHITTDYLVIGAGFSGLSFVDELFTNTTSTITIVDKRDQPGGHWNDSYPFVRLHQPSSFYGVESTELSEYRVDEFGPNKGLGSLATGVEIQAYVRDLFAKRFLPSGRVTYLPCTEYLPDGTLRGLLNDKRTTVTINKKLVDASWNTNSIPSTHNRAFEVASSVTCIPPNDLPRKALNFNNFTVLGAGKTAVDSIMWLLMNGANPDSVRWIIPNDYWYFNRAKVQNGPEFFEDVFSTTVKARTHISKASNAAELAAGFEECNYWLRLDPNIFPAHFHAAVISETELSEIRKIKDIVRLGRVTNIEVDKLILKKGTVQVEKSTLYVDCTASAISQKAGVPIFQPGKVVIQICRFPLLTLSGAMIGFLESQDMTDEDKNHLLVPVPFCNTVEEYIVSMIYDFQNRARATAHPVLSKFNRKTRLDMPNRLINSVTPDQKEKMMLLGQVKVASEAAGANLPRLLASIQKDQAGGESRASL